MNPANEILRTASHKFDQFIKSAQPYQGKKPAFNAEAHKQQVVKNLTEEYNEMQKETEYSRKWWFEFADTLFCAYTALKIRVKEYEDEQIANFAKNSGFGWNKIPYIYAMATAVSNGSKFFDIDKLAAQAPTDTEPHTILSLAIKNANANQWELWQTDNDGKTLYFFSKDGKVQKSGFFGYRSKDNLHEDILRDLSKHYINTLKEGYITELSGCIDEVQMIRLIAKKYEKTGDLNHFIINL